MITDHKPLVSLAEKPIDKLPAWLQGLFLAIQGYNYKIVYKPWKQMFISDCLLRLISTERKAEKPLVRDSHILLCEITSFKARSCHEFQHKTATELSTLKENLQHGWPKNKYQCGSACKEYWAGRNELGLVYGIILGQGSVIVPPPKHSRILKKFHNDSLHQGTSKTELRIKQHVYWPGITTEIKHMISRCNSWLKFQKRLVKPMHSKQIVSAHPMDIANCDVFEKDSKLFHLMVDHYSNYVWVKPMSPSDWTHSAWSPEADIWCTKHTDIISCNLLYGWSIWTVLQWNGHSAQTFKSTLTTPKLKSWEICWYLQGHDVQGW